MTSYKAQKYICMLPVLCALLAVRAAEAGDFKRFELQPFAGYSVSGNVPLVDDDGVEHGTVHVDDSYHLGASFTVYLNELDAVEGFWQRQFTEGRLPDEIVTPVSAGGVTRFDMKIDQVHMNFLHHYEIREDPRARPYVMAGLGVTAFHASRQGQNFSKAHFSFSVGGGMKYFLTSHIGLRGEARWSPSLLAASDGSYWCEIGGEGAKCAIHLKTTWQDQLDFTAGLLFRF